MYSFIIKNKFKIVHYKDYREVIARDLVFRIFRDESIAGLWHGGGVLE
jgi:hypothetical protein